MAWHLFGDKPLSEPMLAWFQLLTHIYVLGLNELNFIYVSRDSVSSSIVHINHRGILSVIWTDTRISAQTYIIHTLAYTTGCNGKHNLDLHLNTDDTTVYGL